MSADKERADVPEPTSSSSRPPSLRPTVDLSNAYASAPPLIRERFVTEDLEASNVLRAAPPRSRSPFAPPPVPRFASSAPTLPSPPESGITMIGSTNENVDPTDMLFDGVYELNFVDTATEAASICADALGLALRARAVIVHTHDFATDALRVIAAYGDAPRSLLGSIAPGEQDLVASGVICNGLPVTMHFDGEVPASAPHRLALIEAPRVVVAVPAIAWGRCVAVIEVIDADEGHESHVADCATYVALHFAEFLSEREAA